MPEANADARLFADTLSLETTARVALVAAPLPEGALDDAERVLRDIATVEDRRGDDADTGAVADPALRRLEAKLDLTLLLLARALPELHRLAPVAVRLGARGLRFDAPATAVPEIAVLHWQPADAMPVAVHLPLRRLAAEGDRSWWVFESLGPTLEDLLERHVFRLHRRALAQRRPG